MTGTLLLGLLNAAAFMLCVSFVAYVTMIILPFLRHRPGAVGDGQEFSWHFVIPCLDEEAVITATVEHLVRTFPQTQLWCVDDGSTDATPKILAQLARRHRQVHVITRKLPAARSGKGPVLNVGWEAIVASLPAGIDTDRLIVGVLDADARLDTAALEVIAGPDYFADPDVGAVQIQVRVTSRPETSGTSRQPLLVRLQDLEFSGPIAAMQLLRRRSGSVGMGGNGQFTRLTTLNKIAATHGTPWHGALLEDFELGLHVLLSGSRTEYCHDAWVEQEGLPRLKALIRQRSRWAQGSMQCFRYLGPVLRSPSITTAGALEIAYFLFIPWSQLVGGLVYAASLLVMAYYAVVQPGGLDAWLSAGAWGVLPLFLLFGLAPFFVWGPIYRSRSANHVSRRKAVGLGVANWIYSYMHYAAVWWAFIRMVRVRHDWKKTVRVATGPVLMPSVGRTATVAGGFAPRRGDRLVVPARLRLDPLTLDPLMVDGLVLSATDQAS
ncbi:MAG TPA: glycosyltransferase [Acidimicrobiales bacterium]|nr:glycosyltransferase [Acidimicrobiales bacterium]